MWPELLDERRNLLENSKRRAVPLDRMQALPLPRRTGPGSAARTGCGGAPPDRHRGTDAGHGFSLSPCAEVESSGFASHARDRV
jgi:hypothetical protein